ncbi:MAG: UDP-3-O-(3-hydroxymyristoyl)glucosamine N-acyltransferase [Candidatus Omnitrophica bacterium]|nr:UDP-3-O-(3-hydroxymyristoyl)glucosamine N-acyltransferase [Candidatus Omnitrophota bacterium]
MPRTLKEIAAFVGGEVIGDESVIISGVAGIQDAEKGDITFLSNPKYLPFLDRTHASAVITSHDVTSSVKPLIRTDNPSLAFTKIVSLLVPYDVVHPKGIHPTAIVGKNVTLGSDVVLGPYVVIGDNAVIKDKTIIYNGCSVGYRTTIGSNTVLYPHVTVREQVTIGDRVVIHSGSVIGSFGFGFVTVNGEHRRIPQVGTVIIEDDVEIGSCVTIDRARFDKTSIGKGTKIDNLVHIAHNVNIGKNCFIVAQVGVSGSTKIGDNVILAGQAGLVGHIEIGDNAIVMAQSGVNKSVPANTTVWGYPAKPDKTAKRVNACVQNLPKLFDGVSELRKKVEELEAKLNNGIK